MKDARIDEIASRVAERLMGEVSITSLLLHSIVYAFGSPGLVVNEGVAKSSPMRCLEYGDGKKLCFKEGIIGALSKEQMAEHTGTVESLHSPGLERRLKNWEGAKTICKAEIEPIPKGERLGPWLGCMSRELRARGVTA